MVNAFQEAGTAAQCASYYYAPVSALAKAREALHDWSGEGIYRALKLMQEAQETDLESIEALHDLFARFASVENIALSSSAATLEEAKTDSEVIALKTLTPAHAQPILIKQITQRIQYRKNLILSLQDKIAEIKERDSEANLRAKAFEDRMRKKSL